MDQAEQMDQMYRFTRHVYDVSRKYFLFGRDRLLRQMELRPGDRILEVGCGTARNLIKLAHLRPGFEYYGLDASEKMLETADEKVRRAGLGPKIHLRQCLAEALDHGATFGLDRSFDVIFFSYSLSMIPTWRDALEAALRNLAPGRSLYIVDFWDQKELPSLFRRLLVGWLRLFHVHYRPELMAFLEEMKRDGRARLEIQPLFGRYGYIARVDRAA